MPASPTTRRIEAAVQELRLTESGVEYAVETDKYSGGLLFRSTRVGAFFYVLPEALEQAREVMHRHSFRFQEWEHE